MKQEDYNLIERYLWGELSKDETEELKKRQETDPEFAAAIKEEIELKEFLKTNEARKSLQQNTQKLSTQFFKDEQAGEGNSSNSKPSSTAPRRWLYAVAAAAAIIGFSLLTWLWAFPPSAQELYQTYAVHNALNLTDRSDEETDFKALQDAFNAGNYPSATSEFESYLSRNPSDTEVLLHLGICKLETGEAEEALALFDSIAAGSSLFKEEGTWYKALTLIKMEKVDQAKETLLEIPKGHRRYASARKLHRNL